MHDSEIINFSPLFYFNSLLSFQKSSNYAAQQLSATELHDRERLFYLRKYLKPSESRRNQLGELSNLRDDILTMDFRCDSSVFTSNRSMYSTILKVLDLRLRRITKSMNGHRLETYFLFQFISEWLVANCTYTINFRNNATIEKMFIKHLDIVILRMIFIEPDSNFTFPLFFNDSKNSGNIHCMGQKFSGTIERLSDPETDDVCAICYGEDVTKQRDYALLDSCHHVYCKSCIQTWFETE